MVANERSILAAVESPQDRHGPARIPSGTRPADDPVWSAQPPDWISNRNIDKFSPPDKQVLIAAG